MEEQQEISHRQEDPQVSGRLTGVFPALTRKEVVVFPQEMSAFLVRDEDEVKLVEEAALGEKRLLVAAEKKSPPQEVQDLFAVGTLVNVLQMLKFPDNTVRLLLRGVCRMEIDGVAPTSTPSQLRLLAHEPEEITGDKVEAEARMRMVRELFVRLADLLPKVPEEVKALAQSISDPGSLADFLASTVSIDFPLRQALLEELSVTKRLEMLYVHLRHEVAVLEVSSKIHQDVRAEMERSQKEFYLRRQIEAIRKELGETETETEKEARAMEERIAAAPLSDEARNEALREAARLKSMPASSPEAGMVRNYLDLLLSLPWGKFTEDTLDIGHARTVLDERHFGLQEPKERILEFLGVRKLNPRGKAPLLCLVGPPGVGKTSLGQAIAQATNRHFMRVSLGGVRDEAEIRGHRRTYIGAMPGRIIQGIRRAGSMNPVLMLDEVDKIAPGHGDPSAALLEVLDPEQNARFVDHYVDAPFDLSQVMFVATANTTDTISPPLLDRMEVISIPGYTDEEKFEIARRYLLPKAIADAGLSLERIEITVSALTGIIRRYTREAGVRDLERQIARICRRAALEVAEGKAEHLRVDEENLKDYLGQARFFPESKIRVAKPGVATGLAWTPAGGDILFIEATAMKGKGGLILTGQLGEVMKESAQAALSLVKSKGESWGIDGGFFEGKDIHIHLPAGAIPKDGPSAGVALVLVLASLAKGQALSPDYAATGEITLRGTILPVGGIKEKVLAAERAGIKHVILPRRNEADLEKIPEHLQERLVFHLADDMDEVFALPLWQGVG